MKCRLRRCRRGRQWLAGSGLCSRLSLTMTYGSVSSFFSSVADKQKKLSFLRNFFLLITYRYLLKLHLHQLKSQKEVKNCKNQGFSYFFCLLIEGSVSRFGSVRNNDGSGSERPKNVRLLRIRIYVTLRLTLAKNASLAFNAKVEDLKSVICTVLPTKPLKMNCRLRRCRRGQQWWAGSGLCRQPPASRFRRAQPSSNSSTLRASQVTNQYKNI
jgi:hypothetical protein